MEVSPLQGFEDSHTMTLPTRFGRRRDVPRSPEKKCMLGKICDVLNPPFTGCKIHSWAYRHDDVILVIKVITLSVFIGCLIVVSIDSYNKYVHEQSLTAIQNLNCSQLAQYIADYGKFYAEAKHRYKWLCVTEQVREFQG